ncbi:acyl-CoA thioesterase II [Conexibacter sp. DBS9H8]|uniref:acyl-CoA thioesterase n=1 Tax=Conexibacter sp. DBS9H8 TaxID=2937801 RepID=UPI00200D7D56|nr:thioesterase family protein [Conexibacter sp. DBS9H8]
MSAAEPAGERAAESLGEVLASLETVTDGTYRLSAPDDWGQGRTLYGGLTAVLCLRIARSTVAGLGPLRSLQLAFLGPAHGELTLRARPLRRGRSVGFVAVDAHVSVDATAAAALIMCGEPRTSELVHRRLAPPAVPAPEECAVLPLPLSGTPVFLRHMEVRFAGGAPPFSGGVPESVMWVRHRDSVGLSAEEAIVAVADVLPPAVLSASDRPRPGSSVTWSLDLIDAGADPGGWFLLHSSSEAAADGYSQQTMACFSTDGRPLAGGRQTVAVY